MEKRKDKKSEPQIYDISRLRQEDIVNIDLSSGPRFISSLKILQKCCSRGGTKQNRKPVTYMDPDEPVCVARIEGSYYEKDVTTYFLILKCDIYNSGYCFEDEIRIGSNWSVLGDSRVLIKGGNKAPFGVSYVKGNEPKDNSVNHLEDSLGRETLLSALYHLRYGRVDVKKTAFHSICFHLCEASRLQGVATQLLTGFGSRIPRKIGNLRLLFNEWGSMCSCHRKQVVGVNCESMKLELKTRFGIDNFRKLDDALVTILVENGEARLNRRLEKLNKTKKAYSYYRRRVLSDQIVPRDAKLKRNWTRSELEQRRNTELERLISQGGGRADIWICLKEACCETNLRFKRLKIDHTDVNVKVADLSDAYDDDGFQYMLGGSGEPKENEYMLCDPLGILPDN